MATGETRMRESLPGGTYGTASGGRPFGLRSSRMRFGIWHSPVATREHTS